MKPAIVSLLSSRNERVIDEYVLERKCVVLTLRGGTNDSDGDPGRSMGTRQDTLFIEDMVSPEIDRSLKNAAFERAPRTLADFNADGAYQRFKSYGLSAADMREVLGVSIFEKFTIRCESLRLLRSLRNVLRSNLSLLTTTWPGFQIERPLGKSAGVPVVRLSHNAAIGELSPMRQECYTDEVIFLAQKL